MAPDRNIRLFGTAEPVASPTHLQAGALSAELENGALRNIRFGGLEVLRGISFLVRDRNWATCAPEISALTVDQDEQGFRVRYEASCRDGAQHLRYTARIDGSASGELVFAASGEGVTDFVTNRTGFNVLHPLEGVVGAPLTVEHTDGSCAESRFPEQIDPMCPFQDVRALTLEFASGVRAECRMEGDTFETEDHRNWMDASFKTYVRPLAMPWPYTIAGGETIEQQVRLTVTDPRAAGAAPASAAGAVTVEVGPALPHKLPRLALAVPAEHAAAALDRTDLLARLGPEWLVCHFDARAGHGADVMRRHGQLCRQVGAKPLLEAVLPCVDASGAPTDSLDVLRRDLATVAGAAAAAGISFPLVAVAPSSDLKCTLPGSEFPPAPGWAALMQATREAFPEARVGGGMFSYFTELNRKRPPAGVLDFVGHSGCPLVHAGDDTSMTETLEALPWQFHSTRRFLPDTPYWIFPTALSMRANPYGEAPLDNPDNIRQAMNRVDPRERGLIGAAWYAGYLAHATRAGVDAITLAAVAGPSGVVYTRQPHAQPWFDGGEARVLPHYHVLAGFSRLSGTPLATTSSDPRRVQSIATRDGEGRTGLILCNLGEAPVTVRITGAAPGGDGGAVAVTLDAESFTAACRDPDWIGTAPRVPLSADGIRLDSYAVAGIAAAGS